MTDGWIRRVRLSVGQPDEIGRAWEENTIEFSVDKDLAEEPNTAQITVINLNPDSRSALEEEGAVALLEAGYETRPTLFIGDIERVEHDRSNGTWASRLECDDGGKVYQDTHVSIHQGPGATRYQLLQELSDEMGLTLRIAGETSTEGLQRPYLLGVTFHGAARSVLRQVTQAADYVWSIQNGVLLVMPVDGETFDPVPLISASSGLVGQVVRAKLDVGKSRGEGSRRRQKDGVKFTALLLQVLDPGMRVQLDSEQVHGSFKIQKVSYRGSNKSGKFYADVEAIE